VKKHGLFLSAGEFSTSSSCPQARDCSWGYPNPDLSYLPLSRIHPTGLDHVPRDLGLADVDAENQELTVDARCAPERPVSPSKRWSGRIALEDFDLVAEGKVFSEKRLMVFGKGQQNPGIQSGWDVRPAKSKFTAGTLRTNSGRSRFLLPPGHLLTADVSEA
jgi:hypothetical protein